ncbi:DEAD/DEAH box helicase [Paracoccus sp. IB05]|uniref:DEAD/DEAH box helicase n=1 Tax=Paracoccus sp. IB05 TaxID=2779367 RepID=UPI0018E7C96B|nr:DEAD/DEAH box helicase [Paracoccus sp. IB05]MBJ2152982.1 DEAD/DEAH box helicase [Paracoccus sp. IB05]
MIRGAFIGIDRHSDPFIGDLTGASRDATALWAVLSDSIADLHGPLITDDAATLAALRDVLDTTLGAADEDDVVILGFAGHGTQDHRLVLHDTNVADLPNTTLGMDELAQRFRETRARAVILLLDCCFSGGAPARVIDAGLVPRDAVAFPLVDVAGQGRILFAASAADQEALEDPQSRHGLFTKAVIDVLVAADAPLGVLELVDRVTRLVTANAGRFGYIQSPTMFGQTEGDLVLPPGQIGARYREAFPERVNFQTTGDIRELAEAGIPQEAVDAWHERFPQGLNELQIEAVNEQGVLDGNSLMVVAPTSAGKTFIGELAALKAIADGRKAVFLLPYKALVNEKFEDFSAIYGDRLGLRIARCSGDWQDQVGTVLRGKYDIAFFTYEKFLSMSVASAYMLNQIGLVVLDEAQFITEPGRGMVVELLLTNLVSARQRGVAPQLITLSAVIGQANHFDRWLGCGLLQTDHRPVPLVEGVLDRTGALTRLGPNGPETIQFLDRFAVRQRGQNQSSQDLIVPLVRHLIDAGEKVIVFRNARGPASGCANYLAAELGLPAAQDVIDALPEGDLSHMSESLRRALAGGIAFHNGDLTRDERVAVERGFRRQDGQIRVLVATSTVAAGVNTPASTVIIAETDFPGRERQPYTVAQYKNMAGRAGRLGFEVEGKAILLADTPMERNQLVRQYVQGQPEVIRSSFNPNQSGTWVIRLLTQVRDVPRGAVVDLIANTYGGYLAALQNPAWRDRMVPTLERLLDRMIADGLIEVDGDNLRLTMLGRACGESPLTLESAMRLVELLRRVDPADATLEALLVLVECLPERDEDYTPQTRRGEPQWQQAALGRFGHGVGRALQHRAESDVAFYARCKRALIVSDWIAGEPTNNIEARYSSNAFLRVGHGDIRGYADGSRFLLESALRIAAIVLERAEDQEAAVLLLTRLDLGLPAEAVPLSALGFPLTRGEILALFRAGHLNGESIAGLAPDAVAAIIGRRGRELHETMQPAMPRVI